MQMITMQPEFNAEISTKRLTQEESENYYYPFQIKEDNSNSIHTNSQSRNKDIEIISSNIATSVDKLKDSDNKIYNHKMHHYSSGKAQRLQLLNEKEHIKIIQVKKAGSLSSASALGSASSLRKTNIHLPSLNTPTNHLDKNIWFNCTIERIVQKDNQTYLLSMANSKMCFIKATKESKGKFNLTSCKAPIGQIGVVKVNFFGTQFSLYTDYDSSNRGKCNNVCSIIYETNFFGMSGPNKMTVLIPKTGNSFTRNNKLTQCYMKDFAGAFDYMRCFHTLRPEYHKNAGYVLDYGDHKIIKSIKNFQLVEIGESDVILQFARTGKDSFILDFTYPLSPLQAFFVAISSIEKKMACE